MRRRSSVAGSVWMSVSSTRIRPAVGSMMRLTILRSVVFPQPEGPRRTTSWPSSTVSEQSSTAGRPATPYRLTTCSKMTALMASPALGEQALLPQEGAGHLLGVLALDIRLVVEFGDGLTRDAPGQDAKDLRQVGVGLQGVVAHHRGQVVRRRVVLGIAQHDEVVPRDGRIGRERLHHVAAAGQQRLVADAARAVDLDELLGREVAVDLLYAGQPVGAA